MKIALTKEMREIDSQAISEYGIPELSLMENAGRQVAEATREIFADAGGIGGKAVCIIAGGGNNGGDALVAARHLANGGAKVKIFLTGNNFTDATVVQRDIVTKIGLEINVIDGERSLDKLQVVLRRFTDAIVDGVTGIGLKGDLREPLTKLVQIVNESEKPVVAIDIPTGVNADTGEAGVAMNAKVTVTFGMPKPGHFLCPGAAFTGRLLVDDIGLPAQLLREHTSQTLLDDNLARTLLPPRPLDVHKGSVGRVLVVAGSLGMTGAAIMAATAALKIGAGVVTLATPASVQPICAAKLTEVMVKPIEESEPGVMGGDRALANLLELIDSHDILLMGSGLGRHIDTLELVRRLAAYAVKPTVMDADAIFAYGGKKAKMLSALPHVPVLTPHLGEMATLTGITVTELRKNLLEILRTKAKEYRAVLAVKGECTIIVYPDGEAFFSSRGNPGMATAGSGDVLAGTIAGLMKQMNEGLAPLVGVHLHGLAGDIAYEKFGDGLMATDILQQLPLALKYVRGGKLLDIGTDNA